MRSLTALLFALAAGAAHGQQQPHQWINVGTGTLTGVYYGVGGALCRVINHYRPDTGLRCSVESTAGSLENMRTLKEKDVDLALVESGVHHKAVKGIGQYSAEGPATDLRSVMSLHPEPYTVVVRKEAGIKSLTDLKGKRFNVGERDTVVRGAVAEFLDAVGWSTSDFAPAPRLTPDESGPALCDNRIDGFFVSIDHPTPIVQLPTAICGAKLVALSGPNIDKFVKSRPYLSFSTIPGGVYNANPQETRAFGVRATLMTTTAVPADTIYSITRTLFENFDMFRRLHPALDTLRAESMVHEGLAAPLHDGAARLYREKGWIK